MDEAKTMIAVRPYHENIVNLQGVCFGTPDGFDTKEVNNYNNFHYVYSCDKNKSNVNI